MRRVAWFLTIVIVIVLAAAAVGGLTLAIRVRIPYRGYAGADQFVDIPTGTGSRAIGDQLVGAGVIRDRITYRFALWATGAARRLKAGEYRFDRPMPALEVIGKIARGDVYVINVTFPEGLTIADMARIFEEHELGPASAFEGAAADATLIRDLDPYARNLEGYLFPETYALPRRTAPARLIHMMVDRFRRIMTPELQETAAAHGLTVHQTVTIASLVEKETARPDERPLVAAVYENRLRIGMGLQCDPTVIYALQRAGRYTGNIRRDDLLFDSPYNTYRYPRLPPGPIASPGAASLYAAVHPANPDLLYFVGRCDGT